MAEVLRSALLGDIPHSFSTREGLEADAVLPGAPLVMVKQVHGIAVETVTGPLDTPPEADALVTDRPGLLLGIVTADCAPVLLADAEAGVIGAAHAGWRGAVDGVIEATVAAMAKLGARPKNMSAAIGPCIAQASYEVDAAMRSRFAEDAQRFFAAGREGHWQFDLPGYVAHRLAGAGLARIDAAPPDTYAEPDRFHSYRRASHLGQETGGRQTSVIALPG